MTELELLCSPFDVVDIIVRGCLNEPIPDEIDAKLKEITANGKEAYLVNIKLSMESMAERGEVYIYDFVLPALHTILSNELHYGRLSSMLPSEVITNLHGKLPAFTPQVSVIDWHKVINEFLQFRDFATADAKVFGQHIGYVDKYINIAFTKIIQRLSNHNLPYDEDAINEAFTWVLGRIDVDKQMSMHIFDNTLKESGNLKFVTKIRQNVEDILHSLTYYEASPLIPAWIRKKPREEMLLVSEKVIKIFTAIEKRIEENSKTNNVIPETKDNKIKWVQNLSLNSDFINLFSTDEDARACLILLQRYNLIDTNAKHKIGPRSKIQLWALVEALQERLLLPPATRTAKVTKIIAQQIGLTYKRPRKDIKNDYETALTEYLSKLNAISTGVVTWQMIAG